MNDHSKKLFRAIFHEAQPIDLDFSEWDRSVRLVVIAWLGKSFPGRGSVHNVDFIGLQSLVWKSNHLGINLDSPKQRFQWHILGSTVRRTGKLYFVTLRSCGPGPDLEIKCKDVTISKLNRSMIQAIYPHWGMPDKPLARPGFKELFELFSARR